MPALQDFLRLITRTLLFTLLVLQPINAAALPVEGVTFHMDQESNNEKIDREDCCYGSRFTWFSRLCR